MTPAPTGSSNKQKGAASIAITNTNKIVLDEEFSSKLSRADIAERNAIMSAMAELQKKIEKLGDENPEI
jgi:hypothetical protein